VPDQPSLAQVLKSGGGVQPILSQREAAQRMRSMLPSDDEKVRNFQTLGQVLLEMTGVPSVQRFLQSGYEPGRQSASDAAAIEEAFNAAGAATVGGLAAPKPRGSIGASGGRQALDMSPEARMARADAMGFHTDKVWYHGSQNKDLTEITPGHDEPGAWFAANKKAANDYSWGEGLYSTYLKPGRIMEVEFDYLPDGTLVALHNGKALDALNNEDIVRHAMRSGYDSVRFPYGNFSEESDTMVVFRPDQIRDVDAAFDPSASASGNLLAANRLPVLLPYDEDDN
jgi:hypothetical protein